jgi:hypothetical protein
MCLLTTSRPTASSLIPAFPAPDSLSAKMKKPTCQIGSGGGFGEGELDFGLSRRLNSRARGHWGTTHTVTLVSTPLTVGTHSEDNYGIQWA